MVTTIELRITESHSGKKKVGDLVTVVVTDSVGDLCPHFKQLPIKGEFVARDHVWAISPEEGPFDTKVTKVYWTTSQLWSEIPD